MSAVRSTPSVAVIVACTRPGRVGELIDEVRRQATPAQPVEVVVVGSMPDGPLAAAEPRQGWYGVAVLPEPGLHANRRRNRGVAETTAPILAFLDDDAAPKPGWLEAAAQLPAGSLEIRTGPEVPWGDSAAAWLCHAVASSRLAEGTRAHTNRAPSTVHWSEVPFCNLVTNRTVLDHVGPPAENDVWDIDDFEFCHRAANAGVALKNDPALVIRHDRYPNSVLRWLRTKASDRFRTGELVVSHTWLYRSVPSVVVALVAPWAIVPLGVTRPRGLAGCLLAYVALVGVESQRTVARTPDHHPSPVRFGAVLVALHVVSIAGLHVGVVMAAARRLVVRFSTPAGALQHG